jgi:hypothetical protein
VRPGYSLLAPARREVDHAVEAEDGGMTLFALLSQSTPQSAAHVVASLPKPKAGLTIPIIIIFAVLVFIGIARKLLKLAVIAAIVCVIFLIYQSGAFSK